MYICIHTYVHLCIYLCVWDIRYCEYIYIYIYIGAPDACTKHLYELLSHLSDIRTTANNNDDNDNSNDNMI